MNRTQARSIRSLLEEFLEGRKPERIEQEDFREARRYIQARLEPGRRCSRLYLLDLLFETGLDVDRSCGGIPPDLRGQVRTSSLEGAAGSLEALSAEYEKARRSGDAARTSDVRRAVMRAKDRIKANLARQTLHPVKRAEKEELLVWFLTWLENPAIFLDWLELRRRNEGPARER